MTYTYDGLHIIMFISFHYYLGWLRECIIINILWGYYHIAWATTPVGFHADFYMTPEALHIAYSVVIIKLNTLLHTSSFLTVYVFVRHWMMMNVLVFMRKVILWQCNGNYICKREKISRTNMLHIKLLTTTLYSDILFYFMIFFLKLFGLQRVCRMRTM